jgi:hypothetical protein
MAPICLEGEIIKEITLLNSVEASWDNAKT